MKWTEGQVVALARPSGIDVAISAPVIQSSQAFLIPPDVAIQTAPMSAFVSENDYRNGIAGGEWMVIVPQPARLGFVGVTVSAALDLHLAQLPIRSDFAWHHHENGIAFSYAPLEQAVEWRAHASMTALGWAEDCIRSGVDDLQASQIEDFASRAIALTDESTPERYRVYVLLAALRLRNGLGGVHALYATAAREFGVDGRVFDADIAALLPPEPLFGRSALQQSFEPILTADDLVGV